MTLDLPDDVKADLRREGFVEWRDEEAENAWDDEVAWERGELGVPRD